MTALNCCQTLFFAHFPSSSHHTKPLKPHKVRKTLPDSEPLKTEPMIMNLSNMLSCSPSPVLIVGSRTEVSSFHRRNNLKPNLQSQ